MCDACNWNELRFSVFFSILTFTFDIVCRADVWHHVRVDGSMYYLFDVNAMKYSRFESMLLDCYARHMGHGYGNVRCSALTSIRFIGIFR